MSSDEGRGLIGFHGSKPFFTRYLVPLSSQFALFVIRPFFGEHPDQCHHEPDKLDDDEHPQCTERDATDYF